MAGWGDAEVRRVTGYWLLVTGFRFQISDFRFLLEVVDGGAAVMDFGAMAAGSESPSNVEFAITGTLTHPVIQPR